MLFLLLISLIYFGCSDQPQEEEHHHEAISITIWTDSTELFMEYPPLVAGTEAAFAVHLSNMKNFTAITEGSLKVIFENQLNGEEGTFESD